MKIAFVYNIFPVFLFSSKNKMAQSRSAAIVTIPFALMVMLGFLPWWSLIFAVFSFITIPGNSTTWPKYVIDHELYHVKQNLVTLGAISVLAKFNKEIEFRMEAAAYGESVRSGKDLHEAADALFQHYNLGKPIEEVRDMIWSYAMSHKLF